MDNGLVILASILGVVVGGIVTIVSIALLRKDAPEYQEPTIVTTPVEVPVKKKPGRPKKVKI
jgi:hypothetical protein